MARLCFIFMLVGLIPALALAEGDEPPRARLGLPLASPVEIPPAPVDLKFVTRPGEEAPLPINLPTALRLAGARPLDVEAAAARLQIAAAQLKSADRLWLPSVSFGVDYFRHDGRIQDVAGNMTDNSKQSFMAGAAPTAVFAVSDALFGPLAARQELAARRASFTAARNDAVLCVAEAYFNVQQARGDLAGAEDALGRAEEALKRTEKMSKALALVAPVEVRRVSAEVGRRRQDVERARERWRLASAELARVLRLDPAAIVVPLEPPHLRVTLAPLDRPLDDLIAVALTNRPELAAQQALVRATLERLRQERLRPLIPSVVLRGASTNPAGTLGLGTFGGGRNSDLSRFGPRADIDLQLLWEFRNLGLGNRALVDARRAESRLAEVELFRVQDRVAAEVAQAYAQLASAAGRLDHAEAEVKDAVESAEQNLKFMGETRGDKTAPVLMIRPLEVVTAVQALAQAYGDYYGAVADYNRAQFRLYRALGQPAEWLTCGGLGNDEAPVTHDEGMTKHE